ncbi:hypothetical protein JCM16303_002916 [Sporobolomyces ruberrimus]
MSSISRTLGGSSFRLAAYIVVFVFGLTTLGLSAAFQDMRDWGITRYTNGAAVLLAASSLLVIVIPVMHFYLHRKRPTSKFASRSAEIICLSPIGSTLLAGSVIIVALQHTLYKTDPFVPDLGIALAVFAWLTTIGVYLLGVSAYDITPRLWHELTTAFSTFRIPFSALQSHPIIVCFLRSWNRDK